MKNKLAQPAKQGVDASDIPKLTGKIKALKIFTVTAATSPGGGLPVEARQGRCERKKESVMMPLLELMQATAPGLGLEAEKQKRAELLPAIMKGHYLEFDEAVSKGQFTDFKVGDKTYLGGRVEAELEEIVETAEEFIALMESK